MDVCYLLQQLLLLPQELELRLLPQELEPQELEPQLLPQELPQPLRELEPQPESQLSLQLHSSRQLAEPYVSPKPQQERGCVEGENRSRGKGTRSK